MTDSPMPSPPYPSPESPLLRVIVGNAIASVESGETDWKEAVLHAAVHGWYEGHIEGEDTCPGCDFRGQLPKGTARG
ncbi:hypothetical protein V2S66_17010 [Streptomyces sp. V4-01]|uniref:Uncharacterized protein n=1 Tax=Actinacidiphila polyblastidii TaxID=3110430 RepID=A0ABU7PCY5_9ACTN|nr:hypothetical protein [Streptomyces sp. V4-01]